MERSWRSGHSGACPITPRILPAKCLILWHTRSCGSPAHKQMFSTKLNWNSVASASPLPQFNLRLMSWQENLSVRPRIRKNSASFTTAPTSSSAASLAVFQVLELQPSHRLAVQGTPIQCQLPVLIPSVTVTGVTAA
jgi:hypothetical protein